MDNVKWFESRNRWLIATLLFVGAFFQVAKGDEQRTNRVIENPVQDGDLVLRVNDGGVKKDAITINGATTDIDVNGAADIGDTLTLSKAGGPHLMMKSSANNNTNKAGYVNVSQYASGANPNGYSMFYGFADSTTNRVYYGGGTTSGNAATEHRFYTAANTTTPGNSATERVHIRSDGVVDISGSLILDTALAVAEGGTGATTDTGARTNLGLGTIATQNANSVSITGGSVAVSTLSSTGEIALSNLGSLRIAAAGNTVTCTSACTSLGNWWACIGAKQTGSNASTLTCDTSANTKRCLCMNE